MKLLMKPVASFLSLALIMTAPGLGCYEAAASGFKAVRVAPLSGALGLNVGAIVQLPTSFQGTGLTVPGILMSPTLTSALPLPGGSPQVGVTALPTLAGAAAPVEVVGQSLARAGAVRTAVEPGASWPQRLSTLGEEVNGIISSRDVGEQAAGLGRIFEAGRRLSAAATPDDASNAASAPSAKGTTSMYMRRLGVLPGSSRELGDHAVTPAPPSPNGGSSGSTTKNVVLALTGLLSVAGLLGILGIMSGFFASLLPQAPIGAVDYIYAASGKILVGVAAGIISLGAAGITAYILWRNGFRATAEGGRSSQGGEGRISPELETILRPGNTYDVTVSLVDHPSVTEEDQLVYYLSVLEGIAYQHDRRNGKISVQGITGRDIRVIAGFPAVNRIAYAEGKAPVIFVDKKLRPDVAQRVQEGVNRDDLAALDGKVQITVEIRSNPRNPMILMKGTNGFRTMFYLHEAGEMIRELQARWYKPSTWFPRDADPDKMDAAEQMDLVISYAKLIAAPVDERAERYRASHASLEYLSGHGGSPISWLLPRMGWLLFPAVGYFALTWGAPALAASALLALAATGARSYALYKVADRIGGLYESWGEGLQSRLRSQTSLNESEKARLAQGMYDLLSFPRRIRVFGRYYPIGTDENWHRWASRFRTYLASFLDDKSRRELVRLSFERSQYALGRLGKRDTTDANAYFSALMPLRLHPLLNERQKIDAIESLLEFHEKALGQQGFIYPTDGQGFDEVDQMLRDGQIPSESIRNFFPRFYALLDRPLFLESRPFLLKVLNRMRENFKEQDARKL